MPAGQRPANADGGAGRPAAEGTGKGSGGAEGLWCRAAERGAMPERDSEWGGGIGHTAVLRDTSGAGGPTLGGGGGRHGGGSGTGGGAV